MCNHIKNEVSEYFSFLVEDYNFQQPITYNHVKEVYTDYIKNNIIISIGFDGGYTCGLYQTKIKNDDLLNGNIKIVNIDYKDLQFFDLTLLDKNKKINESTSHINEKVRNLVYYSTLLKNNPEILNGDLRKFSLWHNIKQIFKT
ncbi:MAG: hypothetical protein RBS19_04865 [Bacteroidales bacterium]|nr:hypothetical protein [Bacteroidales bacterium]